MKIRKISVVLGTLNRLGFLKETIQSIQNSKVDQQVEIIVVDGGSEDGTLRWLTGQKDIISIVQHNLEKRGGVTHRKRSWGYFMNLGFRISQGELICMISDDSILHSDTLAKGVEAYVRASENNPKVGAVAFAWRCYPEEIKYRIGYTLGGKMFVNHGFYVRSALESVNWLEEEALKFYFADGDVCLKMWNAGYEVIGARDALVEHFEIAKKKDKKQPSLDLANQWESYLERWEGIFYDRKAPDVGRFDEIDVPEECQLRVLPKAMQPSLLGWWHKLRSR